MIAARKIIPLERGFTAYTQWFFRRNFHTLYLLGEPPVLPADPDVPFLVLLNHSGWWDVLVGLLIADRFLSGVRWFAVMDERQLRRYRFFAWLGMIGVDRASLAGVKEFLAYSRNLLEGNRVALWVTPQGEFVSNETRPLCFEAGVGAIAERLSRFHALTVTLHYEFWNEPKPEAFVSLSPVTTFAEPEPRFRRRFVAEMETQMTAQLDLLLAAAKTREPQRFTPLICGKSGIATVYDLPRALFARLFGKKFSAEHGGVSTPQWKENRDDE